MDLTMKSVPSPLHTLLVRDLTENRFGDWLNDRKLASAITPPVIGDAFDDVNLVFSTGTATLPSAVTPVAASMKR